MRKRYIFLLLSVVVVIYFLLSIEEKKNITTFLFVHKDKKINHIAIFFYIRSKNLIYGYRINKHVVDKNSKKIFRDDDFFFNIKDKCQDILDINIDYHFFVKGQDHLNIIEEMGGTLFLNLDSSYKSYGEIFLSKEDYPMFIQKTKQDRKMDVIYSFWLNQIQFFKRKYSTLINEKKILKKVFSLIDTNLKFSYFYEIYRQVLVKGIIPIHIDRMNIIKQGDDYFLEDKTAEQNRIKNKIFQASTFDERRNPSLKVVNATSHKRLANLVIGKMRRNFFVTYGESIRFEEKFLNSIIIRNNTYNNKQDKLEKVSKIDKYYYLLNYREVSDFTLYLGLDFHILKNNPKFKK